jgi:glucose-6-phosphate-specific signal transduction histidine kinase
MADHSSVATVIGSVGVAILLVAFLLNLARLLAQDSWPYLGLNVVGAALAAYSSYLISFLPFVVLEGTWTLVTAIAIGRKLSAQRGA